MTVSVVHFADLHLGTEKYGRISPTSGLSTRIDDFSDRLTEIADQARARNADLILFAGDAFKNPRPSPTLLRIFAQHVRDLAEIAPVVLLVGNHDVPKTTSRATSIDVFQAMNIPNVIVLNKPTIRHIETKSGPVTIGAMPYPVRDRLLQYMDRVESSIDDLEERLRLATHMILEDLRLDAEKSKHPRILLGHFAVMDAIPGAEQGLTFGRDVYVDLDALTKTWDYVALGHYHTPNSLWEMPPVVYSGSPGRVSFNEEHEGKAFVWAEIDRGKCIWKFIQTGARKFFTFDLDATETQDDPTQFARWMIESDDSDIEGAIVRVKIRLRPDQTPSFHEQKIRSLLGDASFVSVVREVDNPTRLRLDQASVSSMTPRDLLHEWMQQKGIDDDRQNRILAAAKEIMDEV